MLLKYVTVAVFGKSHNILGVLGRKSRDLAENFATR